MLYPRVSRSPIVLLGNTESWLQAKILCFHHCSSANMYTHLQHSSRSSFPPHLLRSKIHLSGSPVFFNCSLWTPNRSRRCCELAVFRQRLICPMCNRRKSSWKVQHTRLSASCVAPTGGRKKSDEAATLCSFMGRSKRHVLTLKS